MGRKRDPHVGSLRSKKLEQKLTSSRKILSLLIRHETDGAALVGLSEVRKGTVLFVGGSLMTFSCFL